MNKQTVLCLYSGKLLDNKEWTSNTADNRDALQMHYTKWKKQSSTWFHLCDVLEKK